MILLLNTRGLVTTRVYSASRDGWTQAKFHEKVRLGCKVALIKMSDGSCIGGHTTAQWTSQEMSEFVED